MAYTNGIFYLNLASGSDTARTALTSCTASNPSGSITRINKTAHGLVTGAIVDLTLFSSWLNEAWKITVVDADNFDLDTAVWQTTADASGTVTPRGGMSWTDAWRTINSGATAARIQPGDTIRIAKTPQVSAGQNATFTNNSRTVTLTTAVSKTIHNAIAHTDFTISANITGSSNSSRKIGATAALFTPGAAFTTGKVAYATIAGGGTQDFSSYSKISFWTRNSSGLAVTANTYSICLCSDTIGNVIVNTLNVPALNANSFWHCFTVDNGGALGNSIQSVAIYANIDPGTNGISFNNIIAVNSIGLNTIIGPQNDVKYCIQSLDDTTLSIDSAATSPVGQGWSGTTGSVALYYVDPINFNGSTSYATIQENGSANLLSTYSGGWNTSNTTRDGYTYIANSGSFGTGITTGSYVIHEYFGLFRWASPLGLTSTNSLRVNSCVFSSAISGMSLSDNVFFTDCDFLNGSTTPLTTGSAGGVFVKGCLFANNTGSGASIASLVWLYGCTFRNNSSGSIATAIGWSGWGIKGARLHRCTLSDSTEVNVPSAEQTGILWSYNHDGTEGNHWGFARGATVNWQTTEKQGSDPGSWRVAHTSLERGIMHAVRFSIAELACVENVAVTVDVWVKKDHATNVGCKIYVESGDYNVTGVAADSAEATNSTAWQQVQISFTPTQAGVIPIWFESWMTGSSSNTYVGSIVVS
jgi:hypothetical protein